MELGCLTLTRVPPVLFSFLFSVSNQQSIFGNPGVRGFAGRCSGVLSAPERVGPVAVFLAVVLMAGGEVGGGQVFYLLK